MEYKAKNYSFSASHELLSLFFFQPHFNVFTHLCQAASYEAFDVDSNAQVSFFYDDDNEGFDGYLISDTANETDGAGSFTWDTQGVATGEYYIYAMIADDNSIPVYDYSQQSISITEEADLTVQQIADLDSVETGGDFTYRIKVTNSGEIASQGISVTTTLAESVIYNSASIDPISQVNNELIFNFENLAAEQSKTIEIQVTAPDSIGDISTRTVVTSQTFDPDTNNNIAILDLSVGAENIINPDFVEEPQADTLPVVYDSIDDLTVDENAANQTIDLSNVFSDADGDEIALAVKTNSNSQLVSTSLDGTDLTLDFTDDSFGTSDITIEATANGENVSDTFTVTVNEVIPPDTPPIISKPIVDLIVDENAANQTIDLSNVFSDADGDEIALAVKTNSNSQLVSTSLDSTDLTLDFADDSFGTSDITIEATANDETISDTFTITVNEVIDEPQMLLTEVHRLYQYEKGFHLYTSDLNEINYIIEKSSTGELSYNYEAEKYKVLANDKDMVTGEDIEGVEPIYRFFNTETGAHIYTMNENEKEYIQGNLDNYNFEGIKYYAFEEQPETMETIPVYRMFNNNSGAHLYSTDQNEINYIQENLAHFSMENNGNAVFYVLEL